MLIQKLKIAYIHFIRKNIFIFRVKTGLIKSKQRVDTNYFFDSHNFHSNEFIKTLTSIQNHSTILQEAELILQNKFQTLGSELTYLGERINWHQDFKSGRIWEKSFYTKIDSKHSINKSDIKVPWELSRFHQAQYLAKAYLITKDEKYSSKFFDLVNDWIDENPFCVGVNWNCAMEVAIRAVNWIYALHIFKSSSSFSIESKGKIYNSLYLHGLFIRNNLEYGRRNGNHYLSDLMGLIFIGAFFYKHWFGKRWFNFARKELEREILIQVYEDGVDYEKSTYYQRLVTEIFTLSNIVAEKINKPFSKKFTDRLHKMFEFIASYVLRDEVPNVGDCDDGRIIKFNFYEKVSEMRNLLAVGAAIFNDEVLKSKAKKIFVDVLLLLGIDGFNKYSKLQTIELNSRNQIFEKGGFAVLSSKEIFIFFDFGDIGMNGWGGHGHNDILSFELAYMGKRFIVDSGTYVYTPDPEMRQKLRSTSSHNTIMVDKKEQAEFLNLFRIKSDLSRPELLIFQCNENGKDVIEAQAHCYANLKNPVIIKRKIELDKSSKSLRIEDSFLGNGPNHIEIFYHFHPSVQIKKLTSSIYELTYDESKIKLELPVYGNYSVEIVESYYSESYGKLAKNQKMKITIEKKTKFPYSFMVLIKAEE